MLNKYVIFLPESDGKIEDEWNQCLEKAINAISGDYALVKLNIFIDAPDYGSYLKVFKVIGKSVTNAFGDKCPAFNVTAHPPEKPWKVSVEAGYVRTGSSEIKTKVWNSVPYVVITSGIVKEVWAGGVGFGLYPDDTRRAASVAFDQMRAILSVEGMSFDHIIRQWNYIGNILEIKSEKQNYQVFNEVRSENFKKYRMIPGFPAATGVGMMHGGVLLDFHAVKDGDSIDIRAVDNPDQIRPYRYGLQVLKGVQPPQFERAVLKTVKNSSTLFISGTASIIGQDTIGIDDIERQTIVTIDNISKLTFAAGQVNISGYEHPDAGKIILLRVYIKRQEDFDKVKEICNKLYPGVTALYIEADICRDNLLVEIEAEVSIKN
jgi:enamine deaminase RidA (YjgF/YER057c/UK114 family)